MVAHVKVLLQNTSNLPLAHFEVMLFLDSVDNLLNTPYFLVFVFDALYYCRYSAESLLLTVLFGFKLGHIFMVVPKVPDYPSNKCLCNTETYCSLCMSKLFLLHSFVYLIDLLIGQLD